MELVRKNVKYRSLQEWRYSEPKAYQAALKMGLLPKICNHLDWEHRYPRAKSYTLKSMANFYRDAKYFKENDLIEHVWIKKRHQKSFYVFDLKLSREELNQYEEQNGWLRNGMYSQKLYIGVGFSHDITLNNKRYGKQKITLCSQLLTNKQIENGYLDVFHKHSVLYDKIIDYLLGEKFAHLKIN